MLHLHSELRHICVMPQFHGYLIFLTHHYTWYHFSERFNKLMTSLVNVYEVGIIFKFKVNL